MESGYKNCQSCGMPLSRDTEGGGSNEDRARSRMYCSHCFVNGRFTLPNLTLEEMLTRVREKLREMGMPGFLSFVFTRKIPRLARWKSERAG